ncbi:hypothetical protein ACT4XR_20370 (plasmid) [Acinetobacter baumannii]|uniref:hypothetical protein n=1 Tax=Acinetobacter baumannii TaxID=470 RepID=UPI003892B9CB
MNDIQVPTKSLVDYLHDFEKDNLVEINYFSKIDINRPIELAGYFYSPDDKDKIYAQYKEGCHFIGDPELNKFLCLKLVRASENVEVGHNIQSLHTDSNGEDMLTSWIDIVDLKSMLYKTPIAEKLLSDLKQWEMAGVTEIYISWYQNTSNIKNVI